MSAVYSYEAARRNDHMIENVLKTLDIVVKELRPEVAAVFSAFPSRRPRHAAHPAVSYCLIRSSPSPVLAAWHAPKESCTFSEEIGARSGGKSICIYGAWSGKCNMAQGALFTSTSQATGSISSCMVVDHMLEL